MRLNKKVQNVRENGITTSKVIITMNVGCDNTDTCYVSDEKRRGAHWALLVIDLQNGVTYYGDSLGWPLPSNLINTVGSNLKRMEGDLGINIMPALNKIVIIKLNYHVIQVMILTQAGGFTHYRHVQMCVV